MNALSTVFDPMDGTVVSRIEYAPDRPEDDDLSALVRPGRGWVPNIFRVLQWSPEVAEGWARLANALRLGICARL